jgi:hypothetical protein
MITGPSLPLLRPCPGISPPFLQLYGPQFDQVIPLNYDPTHCRMALTQTYAGMAGPSGNFPYNTLILDFDFILQPAECCMCSVELHMKFDLPTDKYTNVCKISLVFRGASIAQRYTGLSRGRHQQTMAITLQ